MHTRRSRLITMVAVSSSSFAHLHARPMHARRTPMGRACRSNGVKNVPHLFYLPPQTLNPRYLEERLELVGVARDEHVVVPCKYKGPFNTRSMAVELHMTAVLTLFSNRVGFVCIVARAAGTGPAWCARVVEVGLTNSINSPTRISFAAAAQDVRVAEVLPPVEAAPDVVVLVRGPLGAVQHAVELQPGRVVHK